MLEMYVKVEDVPKNEVVRTRDNPQSSGGYSGSVFAGNVPDERVFLDLNLSPLANDQYPAFHNSQESWRYRPDMNFTSGPSGSHPVMENAHHGMSSHYDFENEQAELPVLTQMPENDVLHKYLADAQSEEENSDYDNNADESGDDTPFAREDGDEEDEGEGPDLKSATPRRKVYESEVPFHSREIPYMPVPMKRLEKYRRRAHWHSFLQYDNERGIFEVQTAIHNNRGNNIHTVNESTRLCSCGKWSIYHMPCSHAIKCFQRVGYAETNYIDQQYSVSKYLHTYSGRLQPVGAEHYWPPKPFKMVCNKSYLRKRQVQKRTRIRKLPLLNKHLLHLLLYAVGFKYKVVNLDISLLHSKTSSRTT